MAICFENELTNMTIWPLFHTITRIYCFSMLPLRNCVSIECSHNEVKSSVFVSYRQAICFHFVPLSNNLQAGIM